MFASTSHLDVLMLGTGTMAMAASVVGLHVGRYIGRLDTDLQIFPPRERAVLEKRFEKEGANPGMIAGVLIGLLGIPFVILPLILGSPLLMLPIWVGWIAAMSYFMAKGLRQRRQVIVNELARVYAIDRDVQSVSVN
jgi:hypothetical protein